MARVGAHRLAAYALFAASLVIVICFHLGPALLAGLFAYSVLDIAHRLFARRVGVWKARLSAVALFVVVAAGIAWMTAHFLRQSLSAVPSILSTAMPRINEIALRWGVELPFGNMEELRSVLVEAVKENAGGIGKASGLITRGFFHVLLAVVAAVLAFLSVGREPDRRTQAGALRAEFDGRVRLFLGSCERVLAAQVGISAINTTLTAAFLILLGFPYSAYLIPATFVLGILPIIGNILSNTIICAAAVTISLKHVVFALIFLVVIHKGEYFLNSRIIGGSIRVPMWQTLLGILIGEAVMGVPGIILAPTILHYVRAELESIPAGV